MRSSVATLRRREGAPRSAQDVQARERWVRRRVGITWGLLVLNVLTFYPGTWNGLPLAVPIPTTVGKAIAQAAMPAALIMALTVNRRMILRPNVFLCIVSLLVIGALMTMLQAGTFGTVYRTFRLAGFVSALWLLTPWWGRRDLLLVRYHLVSIFVILGSVLLGLLVAPGTALSQGRLSGTLWPFPPTDVAHFAAIAAGLVIVLWLCGLVPGRAALLIVPAAAAMLLLTHTRTALFAMMAGVLVAGLSLVTAKARVRKLFAAAGVVISIGAITLSGVVTSWLARGETANQLTGLTGRTDVWTAVVTVPRDTFQVIFGFGLSNLSFNGLPIDSNWLGAYLDLGLLGVAVGAAMLLYMLGAAYFQPRGAQRALALFLVTYCLVSSFTETGLSGASMYLLELTLAASLLVPSVANGSRAVPSAADTPLLAPSAADKRPA